MDNAGTIVSLEVANVKRLSAVHIKPDGSTVVIGGKNRAGKSSVLDSIMYALGGAKGIPAKPLRNGTKNGSIKVDLGAIIVERTFDEKGSKLKITSKDGYEAPTPQTILDELCGKMAFDPLDFSRKPAKDQLAMLKDLVGLDFSDIDRQHKKLYDERAGVNSTGKQKKGELDGISVPEGAPDEEVSSQGILDDIERLQKINAENERVRDAVRPAKMAYSSSVTTHQRAAERVAKFEAELEKCRADLEEAKQACKAAFDVAAQAEAKAREVIDADVSEERAKLQTLEETNRGVRAKQRHAALKAEVDALREKSQALTDSMLALQKQKADSMAAAKFPVAGLGFDEDGVTLNALPFEQASSRERLEVSVAMGLAMNPKFRVMLIRDGSLLDEDGLAMVAKLAEEASPPAQVWIERVSEGEECSVIIEDGAVKAEAETEVEPATV